VQITMLQSCLLVFSLVVCLYGQPAGDKITSLPNYHGPALSQYSGYINIDPSHGRRLHYWFIESLGNPSKDPVVVWLNGGPGCSSMDGLLYEMGPIHFNNKPNDLSPIFNPWTWVNISSMLFIEAPAGVGFSYSDTVADYNTNDTRTAADNFRLLQLFTSLFPKYKAHDLWIAGESYAGMYVPMLANNVMDGIERGQFSMNLKGVLVGNGVTRGAPERSVSDQFQWLYGHGLVAKPLMDQLNTACASNPNSNTCQTLQNRALQGWNGFNPYYLYGDCTPQRPLPKSFTDTVKLKSNPPCIDSSKGQNYLNSPAVKAAIHVKSDLHWEICSDIVNYAEDYGSVLPIYYRLFSANKKVLIYSGDADGMVDYTYSEAWTESLKLTQTTSWRQWFFTDRAGKQVGGFVTEYKEGLAFATIVGAGHMVPQDKPQPAYEMFSRFITGRPL